MSSFRQGIKLIDSHCHLDLSHFDDDRDQVVARAQDAGIGLFVNPGIDLDHSRHACRLALHYSSLYAAVGIHPNSSQDFTAATVETLKALAEAAKVVAIGEIGLDYHWDKVEASQQKVAFEQQLVLAADLGLPVLIHSRESNDDVAAILRCWVHGRQYLESPLARRPFAGVLHAYSGDLAWAEEAYEWGFVLSLGGPVTFRNARDLHALVPKLRLDRLMLETDAPYLTPHPHRGKRNEPSYLVLVCRQLATLFGCTPEDIAAATSELALRFFGLEDLDGAEQISAQALHA